MLIRHHHLNHNVNSLRSLQPQLEDAEAGQTQHDGPVTGLDDDSPSTRGVAGQYTGGWDEASSKPQGFGKMVWENGIEYKGMWQDGRYHGYGRKVREAYLF